MQRLAPCLTSAGRGAFPARLRHDADILHVAKLVCIEYATDAAFRIFLKIRTFGTLAMGAMTA
jgi:hypothetical protein